MKSLFASLEPAECRRIEEEFDKLTNETAVDAQVPISRSSRFGRKVFGQIFVLAKTDKTATKN
jgi:hypothetical protein